MNFLLKFKKFCITGILSVILMFSPIVDAGEVSFAWKPPISTDTVTGYKLYQGDTRDALDSVDVVVPETVNGMMVYSGTFPDTTDCFSVAAYNQRAEGPPSDVACLSDAPSKPEGFMIVRAYNTVNVIHN